MTCRHGGTLGYEELHLLLDGQPSEPDSVSPWNGESDEQDAQQGQEIECGLENPVPWRNARRTEAARLDFARSADAARAIKSMDLKKLRARTKNCVATRSKPKLHAINRRGEHGGRHQDNRCSTDTRNTRRSSFSRPHLRSREEHAHDILFVERS